MTRVSGADELLDALQQSRLAGGFGGQEVEAGAHARHRFDAQPAGVRRDRGDVSAPDQDGAGTRLELDVEAVLGAVVHDDLEGEGVGDLAPGALDDVDVRKIVAAVSY